MTPFFGVGRSCFCAGAQFFGTDTLNVSFSISVRFEFCSPVVGNPVHEVRKKRERSPIIVYIRIIREI